LLGEPIRSGEGIVVADLDFTLAAERCLAARLVPAALAGHTVGTIRYRHRCGVPSLVG
jgi:hypothetical protein